MPDQRKWTAADVKEALRGRYPAVTKRYGFDPFPGMWTTAEELFEIDLLAFSAVGHPKPSTPGVTYPIVGFEVKVSRGDMRQELLNPHKRMLGRSCCHEFYFAVPHGLLTADEIAFEEPEWETRDFVREDCPSGCHKMRGEKKSGKWTHIACRWPRGVARWVEDVWDWVVCETCGGRGYMGKSRVEREAPTLWVPQDVGLIEVDGRGCRVVKRSPVISEPQPFPAQLGTILRWVSVRPDPRHALV